MPPACRPSVDELTAFIAGVIRTAREIEAAEVGEQDEPGGEYTPTVGKPAQDRKPAEPAQETDLREDKASACYK